MKYSIKQGTTMTEMTKEISEMGFYGGVLPLAGVALAGVALAAAYIVYFLQLFM